MKHGSHRPAGDILSDVRSQFKRWRKRRRRGTPIPAALWRAAVEAAGEHGVSKTAQELSLDYYKLKERTASASTAPAVPAKGRGFLEVPLPSPAPECVLELEDGQGARLRVELKGAAPTELETLARAFWSVAR